MADSGSRRFSALGVSTNLLAISMGDVVIVSPLVSTVPLFTVFLSFFFLKHFEKVTVKLVLGALVWWSSDLCMA
ncbi:hypothetical protein MYX82_11575 [Acidobacteria bacterium AH-259-D05]|nr:hypothetical protein [Acidobacteria bacterium AH-259-D05]